MSEIRKKLAIGSDHAGFALKEIVIAYLEAEHIPYTDYGTYTDASADYPDYAHKVAQNMLKGLHDNGILICGSGIGISIAANRHTHIRCALCWEPELAALARRHNNANVLALPGRYLQEAKAKDIVHAFLNTSFEAGRHTLRVDKINCSGECTGQ